MGNWNVTCAISGLAITCDTDVKLMFVRGNKEMSLGPYHYPIEVYMGEAWSLRSFPVSGKYDDYGGIYEIKKDIFHDLFMQGLQHDMIELEKNERYDKVTKKTSFESIVNASTKNRLKVSKVHRCPAYTIGEEDYPLTYSAGEKDFYLHQVMVRKDVWDSILALGKRHHGYARFSWLDNLANFTKKSNEEISELFCRQLTQSADFFTPAHHFEMEANKTKEFWNGVREFLYVNGVMRDLGRSWTPSESYTADWRDERLASGFMNVLAKIAKKDHDEDQANQ